MNSGYEMKKKKNMILDLRSGISLILIIIHLSVSGTSGNQSANGAEAHAPLPFVKPETQISKQYAAERIYILTQALIICETLTLT